MNQRQKMGLGASAALLFGAFCPVMQIPIVGSVSLAQGTYGYILIAMALVAAVAAFKQRWKVVWVPASIAAAQWVQMIGKYLSAKRKMQGEMAELEGNPFAGLAQLAINSVRLDWGVLVLLLALLGLVWVAWGRFWREG